MHLPRRADTLDARGDDASATTDASPDGDLRALYRKGALAWPKLSVTEDQFVSHVTRAAGERPAREEGRLRAADLYLACACTVGSAGAIEAFEERFGLDIDLTLRRHAPDEGARDELRQMVRARLFAHPGGAKIAAYAGEAPLGYWVRLVALRTAKNLQRHERARPDEQALDDAKIQGAVDGRAPEGIVMGAELMDLYKAAFESAFASLAAAERTVLRLSMVDGLGIDELARLLRVHRATAARRLASAREQLAQATRSRVAAMGKLGDEEIDIAFGMIASRLELSVERVFGEGDAKAPPDSDS
jgi:RNA polymerase sigma-70 factor (ECF subfamily)